MKQCVKVLSIVVITIFVYAAPVHADTVLLKNGDRLIGDVQNSHFALQSAYGKIVIQSDFLKRISLSQNQPQDSKLQTINNDFLSGKLLNKDIQIHLQNETRATLNTNDLKLIMLDTSGPSRPLLTAIFTMNNNDRFSGKLIDPGLMIKADFMTATYRPEELNRIEFIGHDQKEVKVLLTNGDIIEGALKLDDIKIAPDSFGRLIANKSGFSSIQFNARKMVLKEFTSLPAYEKDGDGDGVPDHQDKCPDTPWGYPVDDNGCSSKPILSKKIEPQKTNHLDMDNDGVLDPLDRCPQTPETAKVDKNGCWEAPEILFDFDSDKIKPQYYTALEVIVTVLKRNPGLKVEIQGSTDNIGPESYNQMLSEKRALAVKGFLISKGIERQRLKTVGYGAAKNVASNQNEAGRALNRRIDFVPIN